MFETNLVLVGNVLNAPEWRRIESSGALVANFRVASTARRFDRETNRWVDGSSVRMRVVAWRRLAEGVASSITVGDPVIIYGRVYTRDWKDENGNSRTTYEMEAFSIGHDLARGRAQFFRTKAAQATSVIDDAEAATMVGGEPSVPLTADEAPIGYGDGLPDRIPGEGEPTFLDVAPGESSVAPADPADPAQPADPADPAQPADPAASAEEELTLEVERVPARTRRSRREPVAA